VTPLVDQKNFPLFALTLILFFVVIYVGFRWHGVITHPQDQVGRVRTLLSYVVAIPMGLTTTTLLIAFLIIALTGRSKDAQSFHEKLGQRTALGAIYGTLTAIHAAALEMATGKIDLLDSVARIALWGTLVAISTCVFAAVKAGYCTLRGVAFILPVGAVFFVTISCLLGLGVGFALWLGLIRGDGW
jgi:hypothetical protein